MSDPAPSTPVRPRFPPIPIVLLWLGGGALLGLIAALQVYARPGDHADLWMLLRLHLPHWLAWTVFALLVWLVLSLAEASRRRTMVLLVALCPVVILAHAAFVAWWDLFTLGDLVALPWRVIMMRHLEGSTLLEVLGYTIVVAITVRTTRREPSRAPTRPTATKTPPVLVVKSSNTIDRIPFAEIRVLEASGNYVRIFAGTRMQVMRSTLTALEAELDERFLRVHRSRIVNRDHVMRLHSRGRHLRWAELSNGDRVKVSQGGWRVLGRLFLAEGHRELS